MRIARKLLSAVRDLIADGYVAYSLSLTARPLELAELEAKVREFFAVIARRWPEISVLLGVDRSGQDNPWHVHPVVFVPGDFDPMRLVKAWRRLWQRKDETGDWLRPVKDAQWTRVLDGRDAELVRVLKHALQGPRRAGLKGNVVPPMADRVWAMGALAAPWARLRPWVRGDVATAPAPLHEGHLRPGKVSAVPVALPRRWRPGERCCWCGEKLVQVSRKHQRFHRDVDRRRCRQSAHKALRRALEKYQGNDTERDLFLAWVRVLEDKHRLLRREALRVGADRVWQGDVFPEKYRVRAKDFRTCICGEPMANKSNAKTCGSDACRSRRRRQRLARELQVDMTAVNDDVPPAGFVPPMTYMASTTPPSRSSTGDHHLDEEGRAALRAALRAVLMAKGFTLFESPSTGQPATAQDSQQQRKVL